MEVDLLATSSFKFKAVCVAIDTCLLASEVLSTFPNPTFVLLIPAAFLEKTGYAHWESLLRARAIENSCYVIASAQEGKHDSGRFTYGHSCVIDPWGNVIAQASEGEHLIMVDIDLKYLQHVREKVPSLTHIRKDVFSI